MNSPQDDVSQIITTINAVAIHWDHREFEEASALFDDIVRVDYTSMGAPEATEDSREQLRRNWEAVLPGFDVTQHMIASHLVTVLSAGSRATCRSHVQAYHVLRSAVESDPQGRWVLGGTYEHSLVRRGDRWLIDAMTLRKSWTEGDDSLLVAAAVRAASMKDRDGPAHS